MKKTKLILTMVVVLTVMSFKTTENLSLETGVYGVCNCDDNTAMTTMVELLINNNLTFHYRNNSNPEKEVDIKGAWTRKGNTIYLQGYDSDFSIHNKWSIDRNEKCLKSRQGLNFMRLCHVESCK